MHEIVRKSQLLADLRVGSERQYLDLMNLSLQALRSKSFVPILREQVAHKYDVNKMPPIELTYILTTSNDDFITRRIIKTFLTQARVIIKQSMC